MAKDKKAVERSDVGEWHMNRITLYDPLKTKALVKTMTKHSNLAFNDRTWHQDPYFWYYIFYPDESCTLVYYSYDLH